MTVYCLDCSETHSVHVFNFVSKVYTLLCSIRDHYTFSCLISLLPHLRTHLCTREYQVRMTHNKQQPIKNAKNYAKVSKCVFLSSAVSNPQDCSKCSTLYFPDRPVQSDTISASLGSIQPYATINVRWLLVHMSTTIYSQVFFDTAE